MQVEDMPVITTSYISWELNAQVPIRTTECPRIGVCTTGSVRRRENKEQNDGLFLFLPRTKEIRKIRKSANKSQVNSSTPQHGGSGSTRSCVLRCHSRHVSCLPVQRLGQSAQGEWRSRVAS